MKKKLVSLVLVMTLGVTMLYGCGKEEKKEDWETQATEVENVPVETQVKETEVVEEKRDGQTKSHFTGLWIDEELAKKRPVALMVENTSAALPQFGLNSADIIYEAPAEGGITRCMAIFQNYDGMEKMGNVRSCRHYYCYLAKEYDAIYFHAGGSTYAYKGVLANGYIENVDGKSGKASPFFFRDNSGGKKAPHNYYTSSKGIIDAIQLYGYETNLKDDFADHFVFADENNQNMLTDGLDAKAISMYYPNPHAYFLYNEEDARYYRYEFGKEQIDAIDGKQVSVKNIIIENAKSSVLDTKGRHEIGVIGKGDGYYITNGKCIEINWTRESEYDITHYYDASGKEISVNPGTTWIEISQKEYADKNKIYSSVDEFNKN